VLDDDSDLRTWWQNLDITSQYLGLEASLASLAFLVKTTGPFTGVIGFSQGATLAAMFTSWCESNHVEGRHEMLQEMTDGRNPLLSKYSRNHHRSP